MNPLMFKVLIGAGVYGVSLIIISVAVFLFVRFQTQLPHAGTFRRTWLWIGRWHLLVFMITLTGAILGLVLYPVFGRLIGMELTLQEMVRNGVRDGGFYAFIWAPGISFVSCLIWRNRRNPGNDS